MSDLQRKIQEALNHLKLDGLSSSWRNKNSDLGEICCFLHIKNNNKNRLKVYLAYRKTPESKHNVSTETSKTSNGDCSGEVHNEDKQSVTVESNDEFPGIEINSQRIDQHRNSEPSDKKVNREERKYFQENEAGLSDGDRDTESLDINPNPYTQASENSKEELNVSDVLSHSTEIEGNISDSDHYRPPENFKFYIDYQDWVTIKPSKKKHAKRLRLRGCWTTLFSQKFQENNKICVLKFTQNTVKKRNSRKKNCYFFAGKASCKFKECCKYDFYIKKDPGDAPKKVKVYVTRSGDINHGSQDIQRRQLKGKVREKMKKGLQKEGVSNTYYKNLASLSDTEKQFGNLTNAPSKGVLHNLRKEDSEGLYGPKDPIHDVILTGEILRDEDNTSKLLCGYVQYISLLPFTVVLFTEATIQLLKKAIVKKIPLHLDATGSVVRKIAGQNKPIFYYALVLKDTSCKSPIIPVAELITNSNTTVNITYFLGRVKEACIKMGCRLVQPVRIEVDFSWPLINSILLVFGSENMVKYLHNCWKSLRDKDINDHQTVVHICSFHMLGIIKQKLSTIHADKKLKEFGKFCFALLQNSASLEEATQIYALICKVLSSKVYCGSVESSLTSLKNRIAVLPDKLMEEADDFLQSDRCSEEEALPLLTESTIRKSSPFESHFKQTKNSALSELTEEGSENVYWSEEILKVFEAYMYLYPVWSGSMLTREGITRDPNADVENWFGVVKNTILQKKRNIPVGLFIRKLHIQVKGRTTEISLHVPEQKTKKKEINIENVEEVWRKTPKKVKKSKYFHSPKSIPTPRKKVAAATSKKARTEQERHINKDDNENVRVSTDHTKIVDDSKNDIDALPKICRPKLGHSAKSNSKRQSPKEKRASRTKKLKTEWFTEVNSDIEVISVESENVPISREDGYESPITSNRHGIQNRRNNCWLNSTLQSFTPFKTLFQTG